MATVGEVVEPTAIPGGDDDQYPGRVRRIDGTVHRLGVLGATEAEVDDLRALGNRPGNPGGDAVGGAAAT